MRSIPAACAAIVATMVISRAPLLAGADLPAKHFPHPDRIRYDGHCLTIDGQDRFIFSGAFHYFRVPKELWRDRFAKIKAAGFNAVETYVPWNYSEQAMPNNVDDRSNIDLTDLRDWMHMAQDEFGLYTIIRPGPYICAEWVGGGFPEWLWSKQPANAAQPWLRSDDPAYLAWTRHWMNAVWPVIAEEQITRKPKGARGVILVQIENEYDLFHGVPENQRLHQLHVLYEDALKSGIDVPIFTCVTKQGRASTDPELSQVFDANNYYFRWNLSGAAKATLALQKKQPNAPVMVSELQGGWFAEAGGKLAEDQPGVDAAQCNALTLTAIANGATLLNYYMLVGGSNFGNWGAGSMCQTYDYNAPIRETGGATEKYAAVKAIGDFLSKYGAALARSVPTQVTVVGPAIPLEITARQDSAGRTYLFCRNPKSQPQTIQCALRVQDRTISINHTFPPQIITVLVLPADATRDAQGEWRCEPAALPARPAAPAPVRVATAAVRDETGPTHWQPIAPGASLIQSGVFTVGDVVYHAEPSLTPQQIQAYTMLRVANSALASPMALRVNGAVIPGKKSAKTVDFPLQHVLHPGKNTFDLVYENHGVANFGDALNVEPGVTSFSLVTPGAAGIAVTDWRAAIVSPDQIASATAVDFDDAAWDRVVLNARTFAELAASKQPGAPALSYPAMTLLNGKHATAVYRTSVEITDADLRRGAVHLELAGVDDQGEIFVNGHSVGKTTDWRKPFDANISAAAHPGRNVIAVVVTNSDADGGISKPVTLYTSDDVLPLKCQLGDQLAGVVGHWWEPADASGWTSVPLDTATPLPTKGRLAVAPAPAKTLQKWVRAEFALPAPQPHVWAPWSAVIHASGNGFVYLNGHNLGRYYDIGPQRQFYLPEPWLKTGDEKNVLTLSLTAAEGEPGLLGLELVPYADQAETR